jgi:hypothetical protein
MPADDHRGLLLITLGYLTLQKYQKILFIHYIYFTIFLFFSNMLLTCFTILWIIYSCRIVPTKERAATFIDTAKSKNGFCGRGNDLLR